MKDSFDNLRERQKGAEAVPAKKGSGRAKRAFASIVITLCVLALLVSGVAVWGYVVSVNGRNLPNVYVDGVYVGNMNREETAAALRDAKWDAFEEESLAVTLPAGAGFSVDYLRSGAVLGREDAISAACGYGHDSGVFTNLWTYLLNHIKPVDVIQGERVLDETYIRQRMDEGLSSLQQRLGGEPWRVDLESGRFVLLKGAGGVSVDTEGLYRAVVEALRGRKTELSYTTLTREPEMPDFQTAYEKLAREPENAYYTETFEIEPEVPGYRFDVDAARQLWLAAGIGEQVVIPLETVLPEITAEGLKSLLFRDVLGSMMTYYTWSTPERVNNIRLAAGKLDGMILLPGQTFSYNEAVGRRTEEAGFQIATAYSDGQEVEALGGGICQVSSTLYSATLYARLKILTRQNHYFKVGYIDMGMDATVSWGQPDFRFRNDKEFPIKIVAYLNEEDEALVVEIWGTDLDGIRVKLRHSEDPIYDEQLPEVLVGYSVRTFGDLYDADGNYLDTINENSGVYYLHDEQIDWPPGYERLRVDNYLS